MRRWLLCVATLSTASLALGATRPKPTSPWQLMAICDNDTLLDRVTISKDEFHIPDTGTRWKCKVTALDPSTDGSSASRQLVCATDDGLSVSDGIDTLRGAKHQASVSVKDKGRGCFIILVFGDWDKAQRSVCDR